MFFTKNKALYLRGENVPDRNFIDRRMTNNVRVRARKKRLELDDTYIEIDPKDVGTSFIKELIRKIIIF